MRFDGFGLKYVIITIIIIAFLGLGYYAIKDKLPKPDPKPVTVETLAEDKGMSVEHALEHVLEHCRASRFFISPATALTKICPKSRARALR